MFYCFKCLDPVENTVVDLPNNSGRHWLRYEVYFLICSIISSLIYIIYYILFIILIMIFNFQIWIMLFFPKLLSFWFCCVILNLFFFYCYCIKMWNFSHPIQLHKKVINIVKILIINNISLMVTILRVCSSFQNYIVLK